MRLCGTKKFIQFKQYVFPHTLVHNARKRDGMNPSPSSELTLSNLLFQAVSFDAFDDCHGLDSS